MNYSEEKHEELRTFGYAVCSFCNKEFVDVVKNVTSDD